MPQEFFNAMVAIPKIGGKVDHSVRIRIPESNDHRNFEAVAIGFGGMFDHFGTSPAECRHMRNRCGTRGQIPHPVPELIKYLRLGAYISSSSSSMGTPNLSHCSLASA